MANETLLSNPTGQFLLADHSGDFGAAPATAANSLIIGTPTDVQFDLQNLAISGGARQSAKFDFGATRSPIYLVDACLEFETAPTDGGTVNFYLGHSPSATAGTGNPASLSGTDAALTGTTGKYGQLTEIGSLTVENDVINIGFVGLVVPRQRYGMLVIANNTDTAMRNTATAMDETHITFTPLTSGT